MRFVFLFLTLITTMILSSAAEARRHGPGEYRGALYGQFCPGSRRGGPYGAGEPIGTADQAKRAIETCFAATSQPVHIGKIEEKKSYFLVQILGLGGEVIDTVVVDKRSGRIRSIY
jgi:hypothetical protein